MSSIETENDLDGYISDTPLDIQPTYPKFKLDISAAIVVRNLPKVPQAKFDKLSSVLKKLFGRVGQLSEVGFFMPFDEETGSTLGFAFVEFATADDASKALTVFQGHRLDKSHVFDVIRYTEAKILQDTVPDEYEAPAPPEYFDPVNTEAWKYDEAFRDQFCIRHSGSLTEGK